MPPKEEKKALLSQYVEMSYKSHFDQKAEPRPLSLIELRIKDSILIIKKIQSKQETIRKKHYGVVLTTFVLGVIALGVLASTVTHRRQNLINDFNRAKIPNTNSSCAEEYKLDICDRNDNSTAFVCHKLQLERCDISPVIIIEFMIMTLALSSALLIAMKACRIPKDPSFFVLGLHAKEEDKADFSQVLAIAKELNIRVDQSLSQIRSDFEVQAMSLYEEKEARYQL